MSATLAFQPTHCLLPYFSKRLVKSSSVQQYAKLRTNSCPV